jgi:uncharacterized protein
VKKLKLAGVYRYPLLNILIILGLTLFFSFQLPNTQIDNDVLTFLPRHHPARIAVDEQQELFGGVLLIDVAVESREGNILTPEGLSLLSALTAGLEEIDGVEEVESIFSTDFPEGTPEGMRTSPLAPGKGPYTREDAAEVRRKLVDWEAYHRLLISPDFSATQIGVRYATGLSADEREAVYRSIIRLTETHEGKGYDFYVAGTPAVTVLVSSNMAADLKTLIPFVLAVLTLVLFFSFRRFGGVLLPMLTVTISTIWIIGIMALLEVPLSVLGTVIPVLMLAVGSAYGIHLTSHYYDELGDGSPDRGEHRRIVEATLRRVGPPVAIAGITTIAGFGSLVVSRVIPMRDFGIFTAAGVLIAMIIALVFLPSVLLLRKRPLATGKRATQKSGSRLIDLILGGLLSLATRRRGVVLTVLTLIIALAAWGTSRLIVDNALIEYFKPDTSIRISDDLIREKFAGTKSFDIIVYGEKPASLTDPRILDAMDRLADHLEKSYPQVSKVVSYSDFIRRMNQIMHAGQPAELTISSAGEPAGTEDAAFNGDDSSFFNDGSHESFGDDSFFGGDESGGDTAAAPSTVTSSPSSFSSRTAGGADPMQAAVIVDLGVSAWDEIPADPERYGLAGNEELQQLISQYLLLYSGNLGSWSDDDLEPRIARMSVSLNTRGNIFTNQLIPEIGKWTDENFPAGYSIRTAGVALAESAVTDLVTGAAVGSILLSLALVFIIVAVSYRSLAAGFYGAVPLSLTVLINFGVMGWTGIKLDIATAMVGSIAIGIGIDYTVHFLANYRIARLASDDTDTVTAEALGTGGKAIIYNALSVAAGFLVLSLSRFNPLMFLGILIALTMLTSSLASMTVIPVLLNSFRPAFISRGALQRNVHDVSDQSHKGEDR